MIDIIVANLIFWSLYIFIGTIPYRAMQKAIDNS